jgi:hypothetical protein
MIVVLWPQAAVAPHQLRHALELAREGVPLNIIQRQLGHANLGTTSIYLQRIDPEEIIATVHLGRAVAGLRTYLPDRTPGRRCTPPGPGFLQPPDGGERQHSIGSRPLSRSSAL